MKKFIAGLLIMAAVLSCGLCLWYKILPSKETD